MASIARASPFTRGAMRTTSATHSPRHAVARVTAASRAHRSNAIQGLGQLRVGTPRRARVLLRADADGAAEPSEEKPRFVPAHERTTLSKILPEQLLEGGVLLRDAPGVANVVYGISVV